MSSNNTSHILEARKNECLHYFGQAFAAMLGALYALSSGPSGFVGFLGAQFRVLSFEVLGSELA